MKRVIKDGYITMILEEEPVEEEVVVVENSTQVAPLVPIDEAPEEEYEEEEA